MLIPTLTLEVTLDVWSFDCDTQHCNVMLGDKEIGQIEVTSKDGFLCRYETHTIGNFEPYTEPNMTPKGIPAKIEIPYTLTIPERTIEPEDCS
jgi:hypothetical protein